MQIRTRRNLKMERKGLLGRVSVGKKEKEERSVEYEAVMDVRPIEIENGRLISNASRKTK